MKATSLKIIGILLAFACVSCSSDESTNGPSGSNERLLRKIISNNPDNNYPHYTVFNYNGGRISKMTNGNTFQRFQFEYGNNEKISEARYEYMPDTDNDYSEDFSFNIPLSADPNYSFTYNGVYMNGAPYSYTLDASGRPLIVNVNGGAGDDNDGTYTYIYDEEGILLKKTFIMEDVGNQHEFIFEFDDKINPYHILFKKYGYFTYEYYSTSDYAMMDGLLFPNNIIRIYMDGQLIYTANYTYDAAGYPIQKTFSSPERYDTYTFEYMD